LSPLSHPILHVFCRFQYVSDKNALSFFTGKQCGTVYVDRNHSAVTKSTVPVTGGIVPASQYGPDPLWDRLSLVNQKTPVMLTAEVNAMVLSGNKHYSILNTSMVGGRKK